SILPLFRVLHCLSACFFFFSRSVYLRDLHSFPTRRSSDLLDEYVGQPAVREQMGIFIDAARSRQEPLDHTLIFGPPGLGKTTLRSEEHTSELQSRENLVCRLLLEKKKKNIIQRSSQEVRKD